MESRVAGGLLVACVVVLGAAGFAIYSSQPTPAKLSEKIASLDLRENDRFSTEELAQRMNALTTLKEKFPQDSSVGPFAAEHLSRLRELGAPVENIFDTIQAFDQLEWEQDDRDRLDSESWFALISLRQQKESLSEPVDRLLVEYSRRLAQRYELTDYRIVDVIGTTLGWRDEAEWRDEQLRVVATWRREQDFQDIVAYMKLALQHRDKQMGLRAADWKTQKSSPVVEQKQRVVVHLNKSLDAKDERPNYWGPLSKITESAGVKLVIGSEVAPESPFVMEEAKGNHVRFARIEWPAELPDLPPALDGQFLLLDDRGHLTGATASLAQLQAILANSNSTPDPADGRPQAQGLRGNPRTR